MNTAKVTKSSFRTTYFAFSVVSLVAGALIYPLFRGPDLLVWNFLPKPSFWDQCRIPLHGRGAFVSVLAGSGPDCLWLLSGIFLLRGMWFSELKIQIAYIAVFYIIAAAYNIGQYFGVIPGTFDFLDLLTMSDVALAEGIIFNVFIRRRIT